MLLDRASDAAYIAYQRTATRSERADSLALLGTLLAQRQQWRPALDALRLSLELRELADVRGQYERLRDQYGSACSITPSTPIPPRRGVLPVLGGRAGAHRFSRRLSFFLAPDKPALSVADKQLCVEGLKHGDHYTVTLRAGLPSVVHETIVEVVGLRDLCARP